MLRSYRAKSLRSTWKPAWLGAAAEHEAGHAFPNPSQNIKIPKLVRISQEQKYLKDISHSEYFKFAVHEARHVFPKICLLSRADFDPGPVKMPNGLACIFRLDQECMFNIRIYAQGLIWIYRMNIYVQYFSISSCLKFSLSNLFMPITRIMIILFLGITSGI